MEQIQYTNHETNPIVESYHKLVIISLFCIYIDALKKNRQVGKAPGARVHRVFQVVHVTSVSDSVLSKTAIFPKKEERKREISNESAQGSSLCEANV